MRLTLLAPSTVEAVSLADAKKHMGVTTADDDALIDRLIRTAVGRLEGEKGSLGRCLRPTRYRLSLSAFLDEITLPLPPAQSVERVSYVDVRGMPVTIDPDGYRVAGLEADAGAAVLRKPGTAWPWTAGGPDAVQIDFTAGYAEPPEQLVSAILMHVAHLYENREATLVGVNAQVTPLGYDDLVSPFAVWAC